MQILTDYNKPYIIDSQDAPVVAEYFWIFSGHLLDYTLTPITYLEETRGDAIEIMIEGLQFMVPATWNILAVDPETLDLDSVPASKCAQVDHSALLMSHADSKLRLAKIQFIDIYEDEVVYHPMIPKGSMLCHPVGPEQNSADNILCVSMGPYDLYSKFLNNRNVGEILAA